jgi:hypothetical protein
MADERDGSHRGTEVTEGYGIREKREPLRNTQKTRKGRGSQRHRDHREDGMRVTKKSGVAVAPAVSAGSGK